MTRLATGLPTESDPAQLSACPPAGCGIVGAAKARNYRRLLTLAALFQQSSLTIRRDGTRIGNIRPDTRRKEVLGIVLDIGSAVSDGWFGSNRVVMSTTQYQKRAAEESN